MLVINIKGKHIVSTLKGGCPITAALLEQGYNRVVVTDTDIVVRKAFTLLRYTMCRKGKALVKAIREEDFIYEVQPEDMNTVLVVVTAIELPTL
jgi:phosphopantetheine adenylyltransferase